MPATHRADDDVPIIRSFPRKRESSSGPDMRRLAIAARKTLAPFVRDNIACAPIASALCDYGKQIQGGFDAVSKRDNAKRCGARIIAADGDGKPHVTITRLRAQPNVGGDCRKAERSAAVDRDRNLWRRSRRHRELRQYAAQCGGERD